MKKNLVYFAALLIVLLGTAGCEKQSLGLTKTTFYADIQLDGGSQMVVAKGSTFVDPGFTAVMAGQDVTDKVEVTGEVDTSKSGVYTVTYGIVNADGFPSSVTRTVIVLDLADAVEGFWQVDKSVSTRDYSGTLAPYKGAFQILIIGEGEGNYHVEDLLAGWYAQGAGYGADYAMDSEISIADDGTITLLKSSVPGWGDSADYLKDGKFDAATSTITYKVGYAGKMEFDVTLNKVEL